MLLTPKNLYDSNYNTDAEYIHVFTFFYVLCRLDCASILCKYLNVQRMYIVVCCAPPTPPWPLAQSLKSNQSQSIYSNSDIWPAEYF